MELSHIKYLQEKINEFKFKESLNIRKEFNGSLNKKLIYSIFCKRIYIFKDTNIILAMDIDDFLKIQSLEELKCIL